MIKIDALLPCLRWMRETNTSTIKADFMAGLTGAIIVLPQGIAFATIAGLPPEYGLYTAIIVPILAAIFGSSHHLVSGPTTAISIIVFATISNFAVPGTPEFIGMALAVTFLAGVYQFLFGLFRLGSLINFVSHSVITGFTAGSAILVITSQLKTVTGIDFARGESFLATWKDLFLRLNEINFYTLSIGVTALIVAVICKKVFPKLPNLLIGMILGSLLANILQNHTDTIRFVGEIPSHLPQFVMPTFNPALLKGLAPEALAIALIGLIEATSIAKSVAAKSNQRLDNNQEAIGQGISNMVGSFFSCYAASGSFTRSGVNYEAGAKTPLSAVFAALILLVIVLAVGSFTAKLPTAAMGGIIFLVGFNLIQFAQIKEIIQHHKSEMAILGLTFFGTLFIDIEFAICLGVLFSFITFLARASNPYITSLCPIPNQEGNKHFIEVCDEVCTECPQLKIMRIDTPIFFGSVTQIQNHIANIVERDNIKHVLIVAFGIDSIDLTGAEALVHEHMRMQKIGGGLYFVDHELTHHTSPGHKYLIEAMGEKQIFSSKSAAIKGIFPVLEPDICHECSLRIFEECFPKTVNE